MFCLIELRLGGVNRGNYTHGQPRKTWCNYDEENMKNMGPPCDNAQIMDQWRMAAAGLAGNDTVPGVRDRSSPDRACVGTLPRPRHQT